MMTELERLRSFDVPKECSEIGTFFFDLQCSGDSETVLKKIQSVIEIVVLHQNPWPSDESWKALLPKWLIEQFAESPIISESQKRAQWAISNWIYWFQPEHREWTWWHGKLLDANRVRIEVEAAETPFSADALTWLFKACGATKVIPEI